MTTTPDATRARRLVAAGDSVEAAARVFASAAPDVVVTTYADLRAEASGPDAAGPPTDLAVAAGPGMAAAVTAAAGMLGPGSTLWVEVPAGRDGADDLVAAVRGTGLGVARAEVLHDRTCLALTADAAPGIDLLAATVATAAAPADGSWAAQEAVGRSWLVASARTGAVRGRRSPAPQTPAAPAPPPEGAPEGTPVAHDDTAPRHPTQPQPQQEASASRGRRLAAALGVRSRRTARAAVLALGVLGGVVLVAAVLVGLVEGLLGVLVTLLLGVVVVLAALLLRLLQIVILTGHDGPGGTAR